MDLQEQRLQSEIIAEAKEKAAKILARAQREKRNAESTAERQRQERRASRLAETQATLEAKELALQEKATAEERRAWLSAREETIQSIFREAVAQAGQITGAERQVSLTELAQEAIVAIGPGAYQVACASADVAIVTPEWLQQQAKAVLGEDQAAKCRWTIVADRPISGGVVFREISGARTFDNSLEGRVTQLERQLRLQLAQVL